MTYCGLAFDCRVAVMILIPSDDIAIELMEMIEENTLDHVVPESLLVNMAYWLVPVFAVAASFVPSDDIASPSRLTMPVAATDFCTQVDPLFALVYTYGPEITAMFAVFTAMAGFPA